MNDVELCKWCLSCRSETEQEIENLAKEADLKKLALFRKLIRLNNALVEVFWEVMIYREKCGLSPLAHPHG